MMRTRPNGSTRFARCHELARCSGVTITLTTPNSMSPIEPVLEASNALALGADAEIVSGSIVARGTDG